MTIKHIILTLAAAGGLAGGAAAGEPADRAPGPVRTAVVAQVPEACATSPAPAPAREPAAPAGEPAVTARKPAATARAAAPPGARVVLVCGAADAQAAVVRLTAEDYDEILWSGPDARAAAGLVAPDHPATRYAPLAR